MEKLVAQTASLLLLLLATRSIVGAPTQQILPSSTPQPHNVTESCYTPIATSPSWFNTSGEWANPCSTGSTSAASLDFGDVWAWLFPEPSLSSLAQDAVPGFKESADLARRLLQEFVTTNLLNAEELVKVLNNKTAFIPAAEESALNVTGMTQMETVQELYRAVSLSLVYLEQSQHDEQPLCGRSSNLLPAYDALRLQLLRALCRLREMLDSQDLVPPSLLRSDMPEDFRRLEGSEAEQWSKRNSRDYLVLRDVVTITTKVAETLESNDWTSA